MMKVRLQKFLAESGVASRRKCEEVIKSGRVTVNSVKVVDLGVKVDVEVDEVCLDGEKLSQDIKSIYLFHKPQGTLSALSDPHGRSCVSEYFSGISNRVFPVGRLDFDVSGLLLLTNDGDYAQKLLHPKFGVERKYLAIVEGSPSQQTLNAICNGIKLVDGIGKAKSVEVISEEKTLKRYFKKVPQHAVLEVVVLEGRKHFVKNLLKVAGHPVKKLVRISYGPYELGNLKEGKVQKTNFIKLPGL